MRIKYKYKQFFPFSGIIINSDNCSNLACMSEIKGYYHHSWSKSDPKCIKLSALREPFHLVIDMNSDLSSFSKKEHYRDFTKMFKPKSNYHGVYKYEVATDEFGPSFLKDEFVKSETSIIATHMYSKWKIPEKRDWREYSYTLSPDKSTLAIGKFHSWESHNPVELWDLINKKLLIIIKDFTEGGPATPKDKMVFNLDGSLLSFGNGYKPMMEIWGIPKKGGHK